MCIQVRNVRSKASDISCTPLGAGTLLIRPHNLIYTPKFNTLYPLAYYQVLLQHLNTNFSSTLTLVLPLSLTPLTLFTDMSLSLELEHNRQHFSSTTTLLVLVKYPITSKLIRASSWLSALKWLNFPKNTENRVRNTP